MGWIAFAFVAVGCLAILGGVALMAWLLFLSGKVVVAFAGAWNVFGLTEPAYRMLQVLGVLLVVTAVLAIAEKTRQMSKAFAMAWAVLGIAFAAHLVSFFMQLPDPIISQFLLPLAIVGIAGSLAVYAAGNPKWIEQRYERIIGVTTLFSLLIGLMMYNPQLFKRDNTWYPVKAVKFSINKPDPKQEGKLVAQEECFVELPENGNYGLCSEMIGQNWTIMTGENGMLSEQKVGDDPQKVKFALGKIIDIGGYVVRRTGGDVQSEFLEMQTSRIRGTTKKYQIDQNGNLFIDEGLAVQAANWIPGMTPRRVFPDPPTPKADPAKKEDKADGSGAGGNKGGGGAKVASKSSRSENEYEVTMRMCRDPEADEEYRRDLNCPK